MTRRKSEGVSTPLVLFATGSMFIFFAAAENRPAWWMIVAAIMLLTTGYSAFADFRRRGR
ncbi:hypothetical protein [Rathayibacter sp. VKM Ac-2857]|uniref:hypothetical protein n=1 Tax=Rathayibacter sp. VKM Ac-2857 TaxID=2739020 RepID=UPI001566FF11|nr:hypothetical protein [Rathayibacter sp. VKM Ac-2857]NQX16464.1 hypothetical protein [Rathayibacter sp. VKM Ac-2857]